MTRRTLLALPSAIAMGAARADAENVPGSLTAVREGRTPAERFFVREHFTRPQLSLNSWRLTIEGRVRRRLEVDFSDLLTRPMQRLEAVLECAGNSANGFAVGAALWEGPGMAQLLEDASPAADAAEILLEGYDEGQLTSSMPRFPYTRIVPLAKCAAPETMIAIKLNDRFLPARHGFPARALLPGWYAMDSVKWLRRMVVLGPEDRPPGFFRSGMTEAYVRVLERGGRQEVNRLTVVAVKAEVAYPEDGARLAAGPQEIRGFAWSGSAGIRRVAVSSDGGATWGDAALAASASEHTWTPWSYDWRAERGEHVILARAEDANGNAQPLARDPARRDSYERNECARIRCLVR
jgi:DMSO/TMAO reductase YedYZ molybdopterin-dependent catalytic subunit